MRYPLPKLVAIPLAAVAATAAAVAATPATASTPAPPLRLTYWNYDFQLGSDNAVPYRWFANPGTATTYRKAIQIKSSTSSAWPQPNDGLGNRVLWVYDKETGAGQSIVSSRIDVKPGVTYQTSAYTQTGSGTPATMYIEWLNSSGSRVALTAQGSAGKAFSTRTWVAAKGVAPSTARYARILIYSSYANTGSSYWDQFFMDEWTPGQSYSSTLGTGDVLFVGKERVASTSGLTHRVNAGTKHNVSDAATTTDNPVGADPVYQKYTFSGEPVNGRAYHSATMGGSVMYDGGVYKMWFTGKEFGTNATSTAWSTRYATSTDGIKWSYGERVLTDVNVAGVVRNRNTADTARKYLMLGVRGTLDSYTNDNNVDNRAYSSPDGRSWTAMSSGPVLPGRDVSYVSFDPKTQLYVASTKQSSGKSGRRFFVSTSSDFVNWSTPREYMAADSADGTPAEIYGSPLYRYGEQYLANPMIYRDNGVGPITPHVASSTDRIHFARPADRKPIIPLGGSGTGDDGFIMMPSGVTTNSDGTPHIKNGKVSVYYGGWDAGHDTSLQKKPMIFLAQWRKDGFASYINSTTADGTLTTKTLIPSGTKPTVNVKVPSGKAVTAEVLNSSGAVIPGYSRTDSSKVTGDVQAGALTWGGKDLSALAGQTISLRFVLPSGAEMFSFRIS